jgi:hypothetical protein
MYKPLFTITAVFAVLFGLLLLAAPHIYLSLYVVAFDGGMAFAAQRLAPAIMGLGALLWLSRDLPRGTYASRFAMLSSLVWFGVAATGVYHYAAGKATSAILVAGVSEVILGVLFVIAGRQMRPD